ncbi:MAG: WD40 repeat domain-containing protein [Candidatus Melainabacteria bacterium]|nr:WD40 repeat domain-containing protein [Candidatus Melainabacteria bacterium]
MSSIHSVLPVQVLVDSACGGTPARMVFSPVLPKTAVLLFEDAPPELHDLGKAELKGDKENGYVVELDPSTLVTKADGKPLLFRDPAGFVAYRPGKDELAIVFRSLDEATHDSTVWRINPNNGSPLPSVYFDNPTAVAYSSDGELLAVGGSDGTVTVFRVEQSGEAREVRTVGVASGVKALVFEDLSRQLYITNETNMLVSFFYEVEDDMPVQRGVEVEGGTTVHNMCLSALAYSASANLVATAGIGNEIWVSNPLTSRGRVIRVRKATRIHDLQFDDLSDSLTVFTDAGVELVAFVLDAEHLPVFEERTVKFSPLMKMIGCHHYSDFLFIASLLVV